MSKPLQELSHGKKEAWFRLHSLLVDSELKRSPAGASGSSGRRARSVRRWEPRCSARRVRHLRSCNQGLGQGKGGGENRAVIVTDLYLRLCVTDVNTVQIRYSKCWLSQGQHRIQTHQTLQCFRIQFTCFRSNPIAIFFQRN